MKQRDLKLDDPAARADDRRGGPRARSAHLVVMIYVWMGRDRDMEANFPECRKCSSGVLIPLSDYGRDGAPITYKAWVCTNPACGFNVRIDNGEISLGRSIQQSTK